MKTVLTQQPISVPLPFPRLMIDSRDNMVMIVTSINDGNVYGAVISTGSCESIFPKDGEVADCRAEYFSDLVGSITLSN